jgi:hypothetical protein
LNKLLAAYAAFVSATLASVVVAGEVLPFWARIALGAFSGTGAAAGILANLKKEGEK